QPARQRVRVETVDEIIDRQAQLGITLDNQPAAEEQRIRVFLTAGQQQELAPVAANGHLHRCLRRNAQLLALAGQAPGKAEVGDFELHPVAVKHVNGAVAQCFGEYLIEAALQRKALEQEWRLGRKRQQPPAEI